MKISKSIVALGIIVALSIPAFSVSAGTKITDSRRGGSRTNKKEEIVINPVSVGKPQDLLEKGNEKDVDYKVETIDLIILKSMLYSVITEGNQEIYVAENGDARVVKCHFDTDDTVPACEELTKLMKKYGYKEYSLDVFYDNPDDDEEYMNEGPICIRGDIGGKPYEYYFYDNTLIRRIASDAKADNVKTNDFINSMYKIAWEYQNIDDPKSLHVTAAPASNKTNKISTEKTMISCLGRDYKYMKKKLGPNQYYNKEKEALEKYPFWNYVLEYDNASYVLYSDSDICMAIFSSAEEFWDIPDEGIAANEFISRTGAVVSNVYIEECLGDMYVGCEGDTVVAIELEDCMFSMVVENGRIMPDASVMVWAIDY